MDLRAGGVILERFELTSFLGEGGMGTVWSARHVVTGKRVALKVLKSPLAEQRKRFLREARVAAAIVHPNLVEVHDVLELDGGQLLLVMDLLEGEVLADRLERDGAMSLRSVGQIFLPVLGAVAAAHAAGVVHRDLKPENVFLERTTPGQPPGVKVLDFGIAKLTSDFGEIKHTAGLTQTGSVLGTPTYMAPEQVYGERDIDHRADVWSLGVMAYECLAGRCPIEGNNVGQIFKNISQRSIRPLAEVVPTLPDAVTQLVERMMATKPADRPSIGEVAAVFARATGLTAPVLPSPLPEGPSSAASSDLHRTPLAMATTLQAPPSVFTRPWVRWTAGASAVIALSIAALATWGSTSGGPGPAASETTRGASASAAPASATGTTAMAVTPTAVAPSGETTTTDTTTPITTVSPVVSASSTASPSRTASGSDPASAPRATSATPPRASAPAAALASPTTLPGGVHGDSPY